MACAYIVAGSKTIFKLFSSLDVSQGHSDIIASVQLKRFQCVRFPKVPKG